jgi:hypothetical protein
MKKYSLLTLVGAAALFLTSCLKDKKITDREYGMEGISDVKLVEFPHSPDDNIAVNFFNRDTTFGLVTVRLNSDKPAQQDIKVTLQPNAALVTAYNTAHGTSYSVPPASIYSFDNLTVTIPAGSREGTLRITTNPANVAQGQYAFGFTIASVSDPSIVISENYKNQVMVLGVKNQYDGRYRLNGAFYHPTQSPGYDPFEIEVELHTTGPNSVKIYVPDFGGYYGPGLFAGALNAFGAQEPEITIDPVTNKATVQNGYAGAVTFYQMAPGFNSHYDPATKKIFVKYGYNYSAGPVFNPATNREWTYELTYLGPR